MRFILSLRRKVGVENKTESENSNGVEYSSGKLRENCFPTKSIIKNRNIVVESNQLSLSVLCTNYIKTEITWMSFGVKLSGVLQTKGVITLSNL